MPLQIVRGKKTGAIRAVIYGTEGIGKSTLASKVPDCVILDTEDGTGQIDAARVVAADWRAIEHAIKELIADPQGFKAVIIDTADWLEKALIEFMLKQSGKKSIEDYGFGKGYTVLAEHIVRFLGLVDQLIAKGVHVVFVAHAKVTRTSPPDQTDGYDRFELKLTKQAAPLLKEWADLVLFCNYRIQIVEGSDGRLKAQGGKERVMYASHSAAWDAKNRFGLPDEMPMEFAQIAHLFGTVAAKPARSMKDVAIEKLNQEAAATSAATASDPAPRKMASAEQVAKLEALKLRDPAYCDGALEGNEAIDFDELPADAAAHLIAHLEAITPDARPAFAAAVGDWMAENEDAANAYFLHIKWITAGQTWRDLSADRVDSVHNKFEKFKSAATAHAKNGRKAA